MPRIHLILEDDEGNALPGTRRTYRLEGECDTLDAIERAVETFKSQALPEVERALLTEAQERFITRGKPPPAAP